MPNEYLKSVGFLIFCGFGTGGGSSRVIEGRVFSTFSYWSKTGGEGGKKDAVDSVFVGLIFLFSEDGRI